MTSRSTMGSWTTRAFAAAQRANGIHCEIERTSTDVAARMD